MEFAFAGLYIEITTELQELPWSVKWSKSLKAAGVMDESELTIYLNPKFEKDSTILTCLHEMLHYVRPAWSEYMVEGIAKRLFSSLSSEQKEALKATMKFCGYKGKIVEVRRE